MALVDWLIVLGYLLLAVGIGLVFRRQASSVEGYFLAGRRLSGLWLGLSIIATTFAADTPLAVTGIIANEGLAGNWVWWSGVLTYALITVVFASRWRRSGVVTDVELLALRYAPGPARTGLRILKAILLGVVMNVLIMGWVMLAMKKVVLALLADTPVLSILGQWASPEAVILGLILLVVVVYSTMSGLYGVVVTDLVQVTLALTMAYVLAFFVIDAVGGWASYVEKVHQLPVEARHFFPPLDPWLWFFYFGLMWWTVYHSDGSGYIAQRLNSARSEREAFQGSMLFIWGHFILRTIPWVIVGLAALWMYPDAADREQTYVLAMRDLLPAGWLGLGVTAMMAAFMSTMDTHINWGAGYLVNDVLRVLKPGMEEGRAVRWGRVATVGLAALAAIVAFVATDILSLWMLSFALGAGIGLANLLRWFWWRANVYTEWGSIVGALTGMVVGYGVHAGQKEMVAIAATGALSGALLATLLTRPEPESTLRQFTERVRPVGFWSGRSSWKWVGHWLALSLAIWAVLALAMFLIAGF